MLVHASAAHHIQPVIKAVEVRSCPTRRAKLSRVRQAHGQVRHARNTANHTVRAITAGNNTLRGAKGSKPLLMKVVKRVAASGWDNGANRPAAQPHSSHVSGIAGRSPLPVYDDAVAVKRKAIRKEPHLRIHGQWLAPLQIRKVSWTTNGRQALNSRKGFLLRFTE